MVGAILAGIIVIPWQATRIIRAWSQNEKVSTTCPNCELSSHDPDASYCKACGHAIDQESSSQE